MTTLIEKLKKNLKSVDMQIILCEKDMENINAEYDGRSIVSSFFAIFNGENSAITKQITDLESKCEGLKSRKEELEAELLEAEAEELAEAKGSYSKSQFEELLNEAKAAKSEKKGFWARIESSASYAGGKLVLLGRILARAIFELATAVVYSAAIIIGTPISLAVGLIQLAASIAVSLFIEASIVAFSPFVFMYEAGSFVCGKAYSYMFGDKVEDGKIIVLSAEALEGQVLPEEGDTTIDFIDITPEGIARALGNKSIDVMYEGLVDPVISAADPAKANEFGTAKAPKASSRPAAASHGASKTEGQSDEASPNNETPVILGNNFAFL